MSDRFCIRGCTKRDLHFATCERSGPTYTGDHPCRGCAPREARAGAYICDGCYHRTRRLLDDAPDALGRVRSMGDPSRANPSDQARTARRDPNPPAPVPADVLDGVDQVVRILTGWEITLVTGRPSSGKGVHPHESAHSVFVKARSATETILGAFDEIVNDLESVTALTAAVLDQHPEDHDGLRSLWSVADLVYRWGPERRATDTPLHELVPDVDEQSWPVSDRDWVSREWATAIAGSARTLRRWISEGEVEPIGPLRFGTSQVTMFRRTQLERVRYERAARRTARQFTTEEI